MFQKESHQVQTEKQLLGKWQSQEFADLPSCTGMKMKGRCSASEALAAKSRLRVQVFNFEDRRSASTISGCSFLSAISILPAFQQV